MFVGGIAVAVGGTTVFVGGIAVAVSGTGVLVGRDTVGGAAVAVEMVGVFVAACGMPAGTAVLVGRIGVLVATPSSRLRRLPAVWISVVSSLTLDGTADGALTSSR